MGARRAGQAFWRRRARGRAPTWKPRPRRSACRRASRRPHRVRVGPRAPRRRGVRGRDARAEADPCLRRRTRRVRSRPGRALLGYHLLAFPAQSALLLAPASGSCLEFVSEGSVFELCPWHARGTRGRRAQLFLPDSLALSPSLWIVERQRRSSRRSSAGVEPRSRRPLGAGARCARGRRRRRLRTLTVLGAGWSLRGSSSDHRSDGAQSPCITRGRRTALAALIWGRRRRCDRRVARRQGLREPEPRPTSA